MKDENIKEILPDDFYLNNNNEMVSEIKLKDLNKIIDYITNLQEENVVLKSQLLQDNKSYHNMQDRIKKAIELLNDWNYLDKIDCYYEPKEVIDILKGE